MGYPVPPCEKRQQSSEQSWSALADGRFLVPPGLRKLRPPGKLF